MSRTETSLTRNVSRSVNTRLETIRKLAAGAALVEAECKEEILEFCRERMESAAVHQYLEEVREATESHHDIVVLSDFIGRTRSDEDDLQDYWDFEVNGKPVQMQVPTAHICDECWHESDARKRARQIRDSLDFLALAPLTKRSLRRWVAVLNSTDDIVCTYDPGPQCPRPYRASLTHTDKLQPVVAWLLSPVYCLVDLLYTQTPGYREVSDADIEHDDMIPREPMSRVSYRQLVRRRLASQDSARANDPVQWQCGVVKSSSSRRSLLLTPMPKKPTLGKSSSMSYAADAVDSVVSDASTGERRSDSRVRFADAESHMYADTPETFMDRLQ